MRRPATEIRAKFAASQRLGRFVAAETNGALLDQASAAEAAQLLQHYGLPLHVDAVKNWDTLLAAYHAICTTGPGDLVLDAGAETYSAFLPVLEAMGFSRLLGVNTAFQMPFRKGVVDYRFGDIERLNLSTSSVLFAASLSVIEHGVNLWDFFREMARILVPGGFLFVSMDYWGPGLDVAGAHAYGTPVRIFDKADISSIAEIANKVGFELTGRLCTDVGQRVVHWKIVNLRFTFYNILFQMRS